ncbi:hypothetical protein KAR91_67970 [Candidatus Pacearchaeota archaeon]|nr:hypothetical protein [Candidatus Pacearchaeota archaeon]
MKNFLRNLSAFTALILILSLCASSCDDATAPKEKTPGLSAVIDYPRPDREAEEAALWLSGELEAPEELYISIRSDLALIRGNYLPIIPEVGITFFPPWVPGMLLLGVTDEAKQQIRLGVYHDLDSLNTYYHLAAMDTSRNINYVKLTFKGRLHPKILSIPYGAVPSVIYAEPNGFGGDWSNVYPWTYDGGITYLFRKGEGDCPAGCIDSYFWYFRVSDASIVEYVGTWKLRDQPEPHWWAEARVAFDHFRYGM